METSIENDSSSIQSVGATALPYAGATFSEIRFILDDGQQVVFDADLQKAVIGDEDELDGYYEEELDNLVEIKLSAAREERVGGEEQ